MDNQISRSIYTTLWKAIGAFLAAFSINVFLVPSHLLDGGVIGIGMILSYIFGQHLLAYFLIVLTLPFLYLAYKHIGKRFLWRMFFAVSFFIAFILFTQWTGWQFHGDPLEVVVIGGAILGIGTGLIIRYGGCLDGTEILGLIINRHFGITVGQIVLFCNVLIFIAAGFVFRDWHPPILSLITFMVATKVMDSVIVGMEETKSVLIISSKSQKVAKTIMHEMGLGLTVMYGRGGYSGSDREILYVITERLQLAELKKLIRREDPNAFIAIENLHEVTGGLQAKLLTGKKHPIRSFFSRTRPVL